jgi:hypothetical protein
MPCSGFVLRAGTLCVGLMLLVACAGPRPAQQAGGEALPMAGSVRPEHFRVPAPRSQETIFSPLTLPAPNAQRTAAGTPGTDYWQQRVDYSIEATLEAGDVLRGREVVTYTNNSPEPLEYLWIHVEQNLFKPGALGALSSEPETRFGHRGFDGGMQVSTVRLAGEGGADLKLSVYDTVARLDLPAPVPPCGGTVRFEVHWSFRIPPFGADRMGIEHVKDGPIFEMAQWFPAVAVYDDVHGWNAMPYLGSGEFYTNFGDYEVSLTVPRSHIVAATGELQNADQVLTETQRERVAKARESESPVIIIDEADIGKADARPAGEGTLTWRFKARDVRTFAWSSSPAFLWDGCFLKESGPEGAGTLCMSVYPREALPLWKRSSEMLRFSIDHYNRMWFRYPYPVATNVNGIVGGMEYPMIIFCSERQDDRGLFGVTAHEIGHNWFPMIVSTDERRHGWMDEGFDTFINHYAGLAYFPNDSRDPRKEATDFAAEMARGQQQPMATTPDHIWRGRLGHLIYGKTAVALRLLREQVLGPERFDPAFRRYIHQWAFKSPQPADFFRCMEDAAGADLSWFWRGWFTESGVLDQAVIDVHTSADGSWLLATFENRGQMVMPARYLVTYEGGATEERLLPVEAWSTTNQWTAAWPANGLVVSKIELDPAGALPDVNRTNNTWQRK